MGERQVRLTARQRELARHALGLDGTRTQSHRNRFYCPASHADCAEWLSMHRKKAAYHRAARFIAKTASNDLFWLTHAGALAALNPGETLDPEDFPIIRTDAA